MSIVDMHGILLNDIEHALDPSKFMTIFSTILTIIKEQAAKINELENKVSNINDYTNNIEAVESKIGDIWQRIYGGESESMPHELNAYKAFKASNAFFNMRGSVVNEVELKEKINSFLPNLMKSNEEENLPVPIIDEISHSLRTKTPPRSAARSRPSSRGRVDDQPTHISVVADALSDKDTFAELKDTIGDLSYPRARSGVNDDNAETDVKKIEKKTAVEPSVHSSMEQPSRQEDVAHKHNNDNRKIIPRINEQNSIKNSENDNVPISNEAEQANNHNKSAKDSKRISFDDEDDIPFQRSADNKSNLNSTRPISSSLYRDESGSTLNSPHIQRLDLNHHVKHKSNKDINNGFHPPNHRGLSHLKPNLIRMPSDLNPSSSRTSDDYNNEWGQFSRYTNEDVNHLPHIRRYSESRRRMSVENLNVVTPEKRGWIVKELRKRGQFISISNKLLQDARKKHGNDSLKGKVEYLESLLNGMNEKFEKLRQLVKKDHLTIREKIPVNFEETFQNVTLLLQFIDDAGGLPALLPRITVSNSSDNEFKSDSQSYDNNGNQTINEVKNEHNPVTNEFSVTKENNVGITHADTKKSNSIHYDENGNVPKKSNSIHYDENGNVPKDVIDAVIRELMSKGDLESKKILKKSITPHDYPAEIMRIKSVVNDMHAEVMTKGDVLKMLYGDNYNEHMLPMHENHIRIDLFDPTRSGESTRPNSSAFSFGDSSYHTSRIHPVPPINLNNHTKSEGISGRSLDIFDEAAMKEQLHNDDQSNNNHHHTIYDRRASKSHQEVNQPTRKKSLTNTNISDVDSPVSNPFHTMLIKVIDGKIEDYLKNNQSKFSIMPSQIPNEASDGQVVTAATLLGQGFNMMSSQNKQVLTLDEMEKLKQETQKIIDSKLQRTLDIIKSELEGIDYTMDSRLSKADKEIEKLKETILKIKDGADESLKEAIKVKQMASSINLGAVERLVDGLQKLQKEIREKPSQEKVDRSLDMIEEEFTKHLGQNVRGLKNSVNQVYKQISTKVDKEDVNKLIVAKIAELEYLNMKNQMEQEGENNIATTTRCLSCGHKPNEYHPRLLSPNSTRPYPEPVPTEQELIDNYNSAVSRGLAPNIMSEDVYSLMSGSVGLKPLMQQHVPLSLKENNQKTQPARRKTASDKIPDQSYRKAKLASHVRELVKITSNSSNAVYKLDDDDGTYNQGLDDNSLFFGGSNVETRNRVGEKGIEINLPIISNSRANTTLSPHLSGGDSPPSSNNPTARIGTAGRSMKSSSTGFLTSAPAKLNSYY
eukprot:gene7539-10273_t